MKKYIGKDKKAEYGNQSGAPRTTYLLIYRCNFYTQYFAFKVLSYFKEKADFLLKIS